jgi:hypothetical protein
VKYWTRFNKPERYACETEELPGGCHGMPAALRNNGIDGRARKTMPQNIQLVKPPPISKLAPPPDRKDTAAATKQPSPM